MPKNVFKYEMKTIQAKRIVVFWRHTNFMELYLNTILYFVQRMVYAFQFSTNLT